MLSQIFILKKTCEEKKMLVISFTLMYMLVNLVSMLSVDGANIHTFNVVVGNIFEKELLLYEILWISYQLFFFLYIYYSIFTYDDENSLEFLLLRKSYKKILIDKCFVLVLVNIIIRVFIFFCTWVIYKNILNIIPFSNILYNIILYSSLILIACILNILILFVKN